MSESWLVELVILFLHFWDSIKVPRYLVAGRTWLFSLLILSRLVRIIKMDSEYFLCHWLLELSRLQIFFFEFDIKSISFIVRSRCRLELLLRHLANALLLSSRCGRYEDATSCWYILIYGFWVIVSYTRIRLFEINVHGNWLDVVQGVLLVEWQTELSFWIQPRHLNILLNWLGVILARSNMDVRITLL